MHNKATTAAQSHTDMGHVRDRIPRNSNGKMMNANVVYLMMVIHDVICAHVSARVGYAVIIDNMPAPSIQSDTHTMAGNMMLSTEPVRTPPAAVRRPNARDHNKAQVNDITAGNAISCDQHNYAQA